MQPSIVCQINALNTSHDVQLLEFHKLVSYIVTFGKICITHCNTNLYVSTTVFITQGNM